MATSALGKKLIKRVDNDIIFRVVNKHETVDTWKYRYMRSEGVYFDEASPCGFSPYTAVVRIERDCLDRTAVNDKGNYELVWTNKGIDKC